MTTKERADIISVFNIHGIENLHHHLGIKGGDQVTRVLYLAQRMNKELDVVHDCLLELYNHEDNTVGDRIKECLDKIDKI